MRTDLKDMRVRRVENAIVNLDDATGGGTHWVAFSKCGNDARYYDSFGNLKPPPEVITYLGPEVRITYNREREQRYGSSICGQLCLRFLVRNAKCL